MNRPEMAQLLVKVQLGDNRKVDSLVLEYWLDTIGDMPFDVAVDALRRFRRERPGVYLEPGHLLELAGVEPEGPAFRDVTAELMVEQKRAALAAAGVSEAEFDAHQTDQVWLRAHFPSAFAQRQVGSFDEAGDPE